MHLLTHDEQWISGKAAPSSFHGMIDIEFNAPIPPGTTGGPIVSDHADLVAIFAQPGKYENDRFWVRAPMPSKCLPAWSLLDSCL